MSQLLKQSSTAQPLVFLMVDSTDHLTGKTGLTPTVTLSKAGGAFASPAGAVSEIGNGWYKVAGNATDTATLGPLALHATGTGADPVDVLYEVVAFDPQTAYYTGGDITGSLSGSVGSVTAAVTVGTNNDKTGYTLTAGPLDAAGTRAALGLASANLDTQISGLLSHGDSTWATATGFYTGTPPSVGDIADAVWDELLSGHATTGSAGAGLTAAGSAGDPWASDLSGYASGTAGYVVYHNLDESVSGIKTYGDTKWLTATGFSTFDAATEFVILAASQSHYAPAKADDVPTVVQIRQEIDTNSTKTGYKLASDGLDSISTTAPSGVASNFREMLVQTWRRFFKKANQTATELKTYADNNTTVLTTQALSDDGTTQTQGDAS